MSRAAGGKGASRNAATLLANEQRHAEAADLPASARPGTAPGGKGVAAAASAGSAVSSAQGDSAPVQDDAEVAVEEDKDFLLAHVRRFLASQLKPSERSPVRPAAARAARAGTGGGADARAAPATPGGAGTLSRSYMESVLAKLEQGADQEVSEHTTRARMPFPAAAYHAMFHPPPTPGSAPCVLTRRAKP